jgi:glycosyltransferase involved in cell wall biosynthesis
MSGHRQVYCNVIADWALDSGMEVLFYIGRDWCNSENSRNKYSPYVEIYRNNAGVFIEGCEIHKINHKISLLNFKQNPLVKSDSGILKHLESKYSPDFIFVISGDEFNHSPYSFLKDIFTIKKHSLKSKWIAIFISPYCYPSMNYLKRNMLKTSLKQKVKHFDITFWLDEFFVKDTNIKKSYWLPDISKSFNHVDDTDEDTETLCALIDNFLEQNKGKKILLFFGSYFVRKGLDFLLQLALDDKQFVILRAGEMSESDRSPEFIDNMLTLEKNKQLLNIPMFIKSPKVTKKLFDETCFIALPYRDHYSSSGVMLQALEFGKPVIVPDIGLMARRVLYSNIGITYKHGDYEDFKKAVYIMQNSYGKYTNNVSQYYQQFNRSSIFNHLSIIIKENK